MIVKLHRLDSSVLVSVINEATNSNLAPIRFLFESKTVWNELTQAQKDFGAIEPKEVEELDATLQLLLFCEKEATNEFYQIGSRLTKPCTPPLSK